MKKGKKEKKAYEIRDGGVEHNSIYAKISLIKLSASWLKSAHVSSRFDSDNKNFRFELGKSKRK